jgi:hypothetical protein
MKWFAEVDYHGSRSYSAQRSAGPFSRLRAWLAGAGRTTKRDNREASAEVFLSHGKHTFPLIGGDVDGRRPAECPFPVADHISRLRHEN